MSAIDRENSDYWRELAQFFVAAFSHAQIRLKLKNTSGFSLTDLKVDIQALDSNGAALPMLDSGDWPDAPESRKSIYNLSPRVLAGIGRADTSIEVKEGPEGPVAECKVLKVRPGQEVVTEDFFAMTSTSSGPMTLRAVVYGNELGQPSVFEQQYSLEVKTKTRNFEDLRAAVSGEGIAFLVNDEQSLPPPAPLKLRPNEPR